MLSGEAYRRLRCLSVPQVQLRPGFPHICTGKPNVPADARLAHHQGNYPPRTIAVTYRGGVTVTVRDPRPEDSSRIADVQVATWQSAYRDMLPAEFLVALSANLERRAGWWREQIGSAQLPRHTFVAVDDGEVVGFADIGASRDPDADPNEVGELNAIYVLPSVWGRGVGRALMAKL